MRTTNMPLYLKKLVFFPLHRQLVSRSLDGIELMMIMLEFLLLLQSHYIHNTSIRIIIGNLIREVQPRLRKVDRRLSLNRSALVGGTADERIGPDFLKEGDLGSLMFLRTDCTGPDGFTAERITDETVGAGIFWWRVLFWGKKFMQRWR